jgi:D-glycero-beta-D-manno-heptose-7-phosphate kinase
MHNLTLKHAKDILQKSSNKVIAVIGDVMLDRYFWGSVTRISPESPVPVVDLERETYHLGGAANVANNLRTLGLQPLLCGIIGKDDSGKNFIKISEETGIHTEGIFIDNKRPTSVKTRIIGNNQQIVRLDKEMKNPIGEDAENFIISTLGNFKDLEGIIIEDYNKGMLTSNLIKRIITFSKKKKIPVFVDPKIQNFFDFKGVKLFKPNKKEAQGALNTIIRSNEDILSIGNKLLKTLMCENVLLTLGSDGMMLFESNGDIEAVPTRARHVADVSGAGDTAIATLAAAYAGGATIREAAGLANFASGVVCEKPGIVPIDIESLLRTIKRNSRPE